MDIDCRSIATSTSDIPVALSLCKNKKTKNVLCSRNSKTLKEVTQQIIVSLRSGFKFKIICETIYVWSGNKKIKHKYEQTAGCSCHQS